ncbi:MAG: 2-phosphosulfolactate phosphatase, partial [Candidatus Krumholzibacteria bacterium]|nr:2-phosphosulfolactate phosphatase [Candidatus Krumholzibacteria bacterium]
MKEIRFHPTPSTLEKDDLHNATVVVIDVLRATSTIIAAIERGASNVIPVESVEAVSRLVSAGDRGGKLLAGEQKGLPVQGFDLFNSPVEIERTDVAGKTIVLATSNGTPAIVSAARAQSVLICAIRNVDATATLLAGCDRVTILCGGEAGRLCSEDLLCGGILIDLLGAGTGQGPLADAAALALMLARSVEGPLDRFLRGTVRGRRLVELGYGADIEWCAVR